MQFISNTKQEKQELLSAIGVKSFEELIANIPKNALYKQKEGILAQGLSEMEVLADLENLAEKNKTAQTRACFLGAGAYNHFIPAIVPALISRGEFLTAYTPYQPEASQGTLQATFEFQTMIAELYGMDVANASLYDGASAFTEAALLALRQTNRKKILVSKTVHPEYRKTLQTYCHDIAIIELPYAEGVTSLKALEKELDSNTACVLIQNPNFFGCLEDGEKMAGLSHHQGALFIVSANPIALGLLEPPGAYGADIATGEGQGLGIPLHYGGPYLGLFACKQQYVRKIPGRLIGITKDVDGKRGFVLTLQTREQHIRREKATSNICTNEALMALAATVYLAALGPKGMEEVAKLNATKAHETAKAMSQIPGMELAFQSPFFNEFVVRSKIDPKKIRDALAKQNILGGLPLESFYPELKDCTLYCTTEMNSKKQIESLIHQLQCQASSPLS